MKTIHQILLLLFVVFFGFVGAAMPYPIFAPLFFHPVHGGLIPVQWSLSIRSICLGITLAAYPFGQFIGSPILGSLSDQFGRKILLSTSLLGVGLCYALSGLAIGHRMLWLLILSRLLTGFLEGNLAIAQASMADLTTDKHKWFGALSAMASIGYVVGPLLGGILSNQHIISWFSLSLPFYVASVIAILTMVCVMLWTNETLIKKNTSKKTLIYQFNVFTRFKKLSSHLKNLIICGFFLSLAIDAYYEFFPVFLVGRWQMTTTEIAWFTSILSIALAVGSFKIPSILNKNYSSYFALLTMIALLPITLLLMLLTYNKNFIYFEFIIIGLSYGAANTLHSVLVSNKAEMNQQGEVMGIRWGLRMLGDAMNCIFGGLLIAISINLPIIAAIIFSVLSFILFYKRRDNTDLTL